ncbi:MAG: hypothetical protein JWP63_3204 [Candidatus Solibacter sp.]|nr:hypothetical protein [Candidatus Solibacter sp.]
MAITILAVLVHGYHLGVDDSAIYVPAIKRVADPNLYPFGAEFFMSHAHLSIFAMLVGGPARMARLPIDAVIFAWHVLSIFLLLLAAWRLLSCCFQSERARWCGVALLAATLSVPVTGTALAIMDPYVTARSLSTPATLFAIACYLTNRRRQAAAWLVLTAAVHPQMGVYGVLFLACLEVVRRGRTEQVAQPVMGALVVLPFLPDFAPVIGPARECLLSRDFFFVSTWTWYQWVGVFAPLALLWWFAAAKPRGTLPAFSEVAGGLIPFGVAFTALAVVLAIPASLEGYTRLQPMRSFHLLYVIFFLLIGGLLGEYVLKARAWRWAALFVPLAIGMTMLQVSTFPASAHVEWPGSNDGNSWTSAFLWIRANTPKSAVFALDPNYMAQPGEDTHGFRAVAERSALADRIKDSGAVSLFPQLAKEWQSQVTAEHGLDHFVLADFRKLVKLYPVTWLVMIADVAPGQICPYRNRDLAVCRM